MVRKRIDLYSECNVEPRAPLDMFTAECCSRCANPECTRSNFGNSKFEARVADWYGRLFSDVPRMIPDDPRFGGIAGQKFLLINPSAPVSTTWVDPRDLDSATENSPPGPAVRSLTEPCGLEIAPAPIPEPPAASAAAAQSPAAPEPTPALAQSPTPGPAGTPTPAGPGPELAFVNTPAKHGQMIGNRSKAPAQEWRSPSHELPPSTTEVVKTGARVRLGS